MRRHKLFCNVCEFSVVTDVFFWSLAVLLHFLWIFPWGDNMDPREKMTANRKAAPVSPFLGLFPHSWWQVNHLSTWSLIEIHTQCLPSAFTSQQLTFCQQRIYLVLEQVILEWVVIYQGYHYGWNFITNLLSTHMYSLKSSIWLLQNISKKSSFQVLESSSSH